MKRETAFLHAILLALAIPATAAQHPAAPTQPDYGSSFSVRHRALAPLQQFAHIVQERNLCPPSPLYPHVEEIRGEIPLAKPSPQARSAVFHSHALPDRTGLSRRTGFMISQA